MFENVIPLKKKYEELLTRMQMPETYSDISKYSVCERELRELTPIIEAYDRYIDAVKSYKETEEMLNDNELRELALEEIEQSRALVSECENILNFLFLPKDPLDDKNIILEIRAGVGGEESSLFAGDLYTMYCNYAKLKGWTAELFSLTETELGGIKEISFRLAGTEVYSRLKFEAGTHRVQRIPATESGGRIHTSAATVAVLPELEEEDFDICLSDLKIDTFRSSGAGGQHVNKTESAIRITHIPTGMVVECQDERSQHKNKERAIKILRAKLYEAEKRRQDEERASERKNQVGTGDRSERIRTYNYPQNRVTDHRLQGENKNFNIWQIMNGELDKIIDQLLAEERSRAFSEENKM